LHSKKEKRLPTQFN